MDTKDDLHSKVQTYAINDEPEQHSMDQLDPTGVLVKPKWRGTSMDKMDMEVLGRNQVLRRNFRFLSMLGFGSTLICTWEILLALKLMLGTAEEVEDASRTLPRSIMWSVYLNGAMGFIMAITMCYCLGDLSKIVDTPTGYPFIQVFYNATNSYVAANIMTAIMIVTLTACCISEVATSSRQLWSFARDKGIPFSDWFAYVSLSMIYSGPWLTFEPGLAHDAHTPSCGPCLYDYYLRGVVDQYWLYRRLKRHRLPRGRISPDVLLHHDRLSNLETSEGRTITAPTMVSWQIWVDDQHPLASLPHPHLVLCFLATINPG
ncbi:MAG: hypothetical protein Q9225_004487 [Loekoesia sp. 1 TL-2023]